MKHPYKEAEGIEMLILELLEENPVTLENARNWVTFCRTIASELDIIQKQARILLLMRLKGK